MRFFIPVLLLLTLTATFQQHIKAGLTWSTPINQQELLLNAVRENSVTAIDTAILNGANPIKIYDTGQNLIHVASEHGSEAALNLILTKIKPDKLKEYIDAQDNLGNSPLHLASINNHTNVTTILLDQNGIKIQTKNKQGNTPIHIAALKNHHETLESFFKKHHNLNINIENNLGNRPLHLSASNNSLETLEYILNLRGKNLEINAQNNTGDTALHLSAKYGADKTMQALMDDHRIDLTIKNKDNKTAKNLALENDNELVLNIFAKKLEAELNQAEKEFALQQASADAKAKADKQDERKKKQELKQIQSQIDQKEEAIELLNKLQESENTKQKLSLNNLCTQNKINRLEIEIHRKERYLNYLSDTATKIQATFRGYNTRQNLKQQQKTRAAIIIKKAIRKYMEREKLKHEKETESAIKIQALARGYIARRRYQELKKQKEAEIKQQKLERKQMEIKEDLSKKTEESNKLKKQKEAELKQQKPEQKQMKYEDVLSKRVQRMNKIQNSLLKFMSELGISENAVQTNKINWLKKLAPKIMTHFSQLKDEKNHTILHLFATYGLLDENLIREFIKNGGDINTQNNSGETALHLSILNGYNEQSEILIELGADITAANNQKDLALHFAILAHNNKTFLTQEKDPKPRDNTELIEKLINEKTINAKDSDGNTPLHLVAYNGHTDLIEVLVNSGGANIDAQNKRGGTALHLSAIKNHTKTVKKLIDFKASVLKKTCPVKPARKGFTPWDYVKGKKGFEKTTKELDEAYLPQLKEKNPKRYAQEIAAQKNTRKRTPRK